MLNEISVKIINEEVTKKNKNVCTKVTNIIYIITSKRIT